MHPKEEKIRQEFSHLKSKLLEIQVQQKNLPIKHLARKGVATCLMICDTIPELFFGNYFTQGKIALSIPGIAKDVQELYKAMQGSGEPDLQMQQVALALLDLNNVFLEDPSLFDHVFDINSKSLVLIRTALAKINKKYENYDFKKNTPGVIASNQEKIFIFLEDYQKQLLDRRDDVFMSIATIFSEFNSLRSMPEKEGVEKFDHQLEMTMNFNKLIVRLKAKRIELENDITLPDNIVSVKKINGRVDKGEEPIKAYLLKHIDDDIKKITEELVEMVRSAVESIKISNSEKGEIQALESAMADAKTAEQIDALLDKCNQTLTRLRLKNDNNVALGALVVKMEEKFGKKASEMSFDELTLRDGIVAGYKQHLKESVSQQIAVIEGYKKSLHEKRLGLLSPSGQAIQRIRKNNEVQIDKANNIISQKEADIAKTWGNLDQIRKNHLRQSQPEIDQLAHDLEAAGLKSEMLKLNLNLMKAKGYEYTLPYENMLEQGKVFAKVLADTSNRTEVQDKWEEHKAVQDAQAKSWTKFANPYYQTGYGAVQTYRNDIVSEAEKQVERLEKMKEDLQTRLTDANQIAIKNEIDEQRNLIRRLTIYAPLITQLESLEKDASQLVAEYKQLVEKIHASPLQSHNDFKLPKAISDFRSAKQHIDKRIQDLQGDLSKWIKNMDDYNKYHNQGPGDEVKAYIEVVKILDEVQNHQAKQTSSIIEGMTLIADFEKIQTSIADDLQVMRGLTQTSRDEYTLDDILRFRDGVDDKLNQYKKALDRLNAQTIQLTEVQRATIEVIKKSISNMLDISYREDAKKAALNLHGNYLRQTYVKEYVPLLDNYLTYRNGRKIMSVKDFFSSGDGHIRAAYIDALKRVLADFRDKEITAEQLQITLTNGMQKFPAGLTSGKERGQSLHGVLNEMSNELRNLNSAKSSVDINHIMPQS